MDTLEIIRPGVAQRQNSAQVHPIILPGGGGAGFWPLSRESFPKELLALASERTLLQETALRHPSGIDFAAPILICDDAHRFVVDSQLRDVGIRPQAILLEPHARGTGPSLAVAAIWLLSRSPDALMLVQPGDQSVSDPVVFRRQVAAAGPAAQSGRLVAFGARPTRPDGERRYIHAGTRCPDSADIRAVHRFVETPDLSTLGHRIADGSLFWNTGMFLFSARAFIKELSRIHPTMVDACEEAVRFGREELGFLRLDNESYGKVHPISIESAVMECTDRVSTVVLDTGWSDARSWHALHESGKVDDRGNVLRGDVLVGRVRNSYIRSESGLVAAIGVDNITVVVTDDAVLVAGPDSTRELERLVAALSRKRGNADQHATAHQPWGRHRTIDCGDRFQVKRITVDPGGRLSLRKHHHRAEHWIVVRGTALVQRGHDQSLLTENESIYIPIGTEYRLENPGKLPLELIEVRSGTYLGEDDIVRLADDYGRA
jgi:mannose-1-phosphate guanylyltransferase/mannose-6-phosphate isomerase